MLDLPRLHRLHRLALATACIFGPLATASPAAETRADPPDLFLTDGARLVEVRERFRAGDAGLTPVVEDLRRRADEAMVLPMPSVVDKERIAPSGDPHDYVSLSPYWWPNPDTHDGLPYVRRDGEVNPERDSYDVSKLQDFGNAVRELGFAYFYTGEERYAENAVRRIEHFLLDPDTRMNPRMQYGQFIPGASGGRKYGIIETLRLRWVPEAVTLLRESPAMTDEVFEGTRKWFGDYATWINTSELGIAERDGENNHGTWAEAQIAYFGAFGGHEDLLREMVARFPARIAQQIEPDGTQPEELDRTNALHYSEFNLRGLTELAVLGERIDADLWAFETDDGAGIEAAYTFLLPYLSGERAWPYQQIGSLDAKQKNWVQTLRRVANAYDDPRAEAVVDGFDDLRSESLIYLELVVPEDAE